MSSIPFVGRVLVAVVFVLGTRALAEPLFTGPVLTREALVEAVLAHNPSLESAQHAWQAALAEASAASALPDPSVMVEVAPISPFSGPFGAGVSVSQMLPWPGKRALREETQRALAEATRLGLEGTRLELALSASELFDQYYLVERALEINGEHRLLLEDFKRVATAQFATGGASMQDPLQAEAEIGELVRRDVALASERRLVVAQLNRLLHRAPGEPLPPPPSALAPVTVRPMEGLDPSQRPEILAANARLEAAQKGTALAEKAWRPDFEVMTSYNNMWEHASHRWMVGVGVTVPLWRDRLRAEQKAAEERVAEARGEARRAQNDVRFEIEAARAQVDDADRQLEVFRSRLLPAAEDRVKAARAGFESGGNSFLALIEAERNQRSVRLSYEETLTRLSRSRAGLARALGEFPVDVNASRPSAGDAR